MPPPNSPLIYADGASKDGVKIYTIAIDLIAELEPTCLILLLGI